MLCGRAKTRTYSSFSVASKIFFFFNSIFMYVIIQSKSIKVVGHRSDWRLYFALNNDCKSGELSNIIVGSRFKLVRQCRTYRYTFID